MAAVQGLPQSVAAASWTHASDRVVDHKPKKRRLPPGLGQGVPISEEINHRVEQLVVAWRRLHLCSGNEAGVARKADKRSNHDRLTAVFLHEVVYR